MVDASLRVRVGLDYVWKKNVFYNQRIKNKEIIFIKIIILLL